MGQPVRLFDKYAWYDDLVHVLLPMLTCAATYIALARAEVLLDPSHRTLHRHEIGVLVITFLIGLGFTAI